MNDTTSGNGQHIFTFKDEEGHQYTITVTGIPSSDMPRAISEFKVVIPAIQNNNYPELIELYREGDLLPSVKTLIGKILDQVARNCIEICKVHNFYGILVDISEDITVSRSVRDAAKKEITPTVLAYAKQHAPEGKVEWILRALEPVRDKLKQHESQQMIKHLEEATKALIVKFNLGIVNGYVDADMQKELQLAATIPVISREAVADVKCVLRGAKKLQPSDNAFARIRGRIREKFPSLQKTLKV